MSNTIQTFSIITLFPDMFSGVFCQGVLGRAVEKSILSVRFFNPRDFSDNKHGRVDDKPYGGGAGMIMRYAPLKNAVEAAKNGMDSNYVIYLSPKGEVFSQEKSFKLRAEKHCILICGRYEGVDHRIMSLVDEEISIGNYVLTGGEIAAMALVDCIGRLQEGVLGNPESVLYESFSCENLLEYPQYTRPPEVDGLYVPDVLLGGDHAKIHRWKNEHSYHANGNKNK